MTDRTANLLARLGLTHPIFQAPMAGVSSPALAAAVSNAGGLGSLGVGASTVAQAEQSIVVTQALTSRPINVNLFCHQPARHDPQAAQAWLQSLQPLFTQYGLTLPGRLNEIYTSFVVNDAMLGMLLATKPAVVSFHFGLPPTAWVHALKQAGIYTLATATNLNEVQQIEAAGVDAIVAQGYEAGGHRGVFDMHAPDEAMSTLALVRLFSEHSRLPVIAAGGIMNGADIAEALAAGAAAAQLGTAFVLCPESLASAAYRQAIQPPADLETVMTPVISGRPARGVRNRLVTHFEAVSDAVVPDYPYPYDAAKQLHAAASAAGDHGFGAHWAGEGVARARAMPAAELMHLLVQELGSVAVRAFVKD